MSPEKEYVKLRKKYKKLPEWSWIQKNFKMKFDDEGPVLEEIRHGMTDKIENIAQNVIEPVISMSESYCCWFERKMITPQEKDKMFQIYKQLLSLIWASNRVSVEFSEKDLAEWIVEVKKHWDPMKNGVVAFCKTLETGWKTYESKEEKTAYHG